MNVAKTQSSDTFTILNADYQNRTSERYKKCKLLNEIQHIDIFGKSYEDRIREKIYGTTCSISVTSISPSRRDVESNGTNSDSSLKNIESKLSRLSITTKISGLYPGNDILARKQKKRLRMTGRGVGEIC
ncbi:hypothetical protein K1T71_014653 [Dendrolimus kikuchii]|uniref:Uncharacterized protein n=1 Tax=Dendrolimus kikuchii TaxID=765133 RepID=A0ACC1CF25_9NEOP|nr:hypothetical protein K1T71_014653 [Dendrolimus kikuchii]